jgi:predicted SAM-dependent methyltransferase
MRIPEPVFRSLKAVDNALPWDLVLRGKAVECPCCGGSFRRLRSLNGRPNARCPRCNALERHRVLWLYLRDRADLFNTPARLLHFAAEPGFEDRLRAMDNLDYASVDLYPKNPFQQRIDITDMPYADGSWDVVMANHVFGEVPDDRKAMREVFRVLKPGGRLISQTAVDHSLAETTERTRVHSKGRVPRGGEQAIGANIRRYGEDYADRLREAGFEVQFVPYVEELDEATIERYALREHGANLTGNDIYLGLKPVA